MKPLSRLRLIRRDLTSINSPARSGRTMIVLVNHSSICARLMEDPRYLGTRCRCRDCTMITCQRENSYLARDAGFLRKLRAESQRKIEIFGQRQKTESLVQSSYSVVLEYRIRDARISCTCASYARMHAMNQIAARRVNKNLQGDVYKRRYMGMHAHSAVIYHFDAIQITLKLHASRFQSTNSTSTSGGCNLTKSEGTS